MATGVSKMPLCPVCWYECDTLEHTPDGVMCAHCRDSFEVSPCRACDRGYCEYCDSIDLDAFRKGAKE